jgi:hypothetical protein
MRRLLFFCIFIGLVGCDQFTGPTIRNEFPVVVNLTVTYSDGTVFSEAWPSCRLINLGATEVGKWGVKPKKGVFVEEVLVKAEEKVVHRFDKSAIDNFAKKAKELDKHLIWVVDSLGISFTKNKQCSLLINQSGQSRMALSLINGVRVFDLSSFQAKRINGVRVFDFAVELIRHKVYSYR